MSDDEGYDSATDEEEEEDEIDADADADQEAHETKQVELKGAERVSIPYLTDFERAKIKGQRVTEISKGDPIRIDLRNPDEFEGDPENIFDIAEAEIRLKRINVSVVRKVSEGFYEVWDLRELTDLSG